MNQISKAVLVLISLFVGACSSSQMKESDFLDPQISRGPSGQAEPEPIIGIFGDLHEEGGAEDLLLQNFQKAHITDMIALGDFVLWGGTDALSAALMKLGPGTGLSKEHIYVMPGNWEQTLSDPEQVDQMLSQYGTLVTPTYDGVGLINVAGMKISAGHFPQHPIPTALLPPAKFIQSIEGQLTIVETMPRNLYPPAGVTLELYSHTHVGGIYYDAQRNFWSMNSGDLESKRKRNVEPQAFAILYPLRNRVRFFELKHGTLLLDVDLSKTNVACGLQPCSLRGSRANWFRRWFGWL